MNTVVKTRFINKNLISLALFIVNFLCAYSLYADSDKDLSVKITPSKESYSPGDTLVLAISVTIPRDYHLYGNPLGPGIGKPLQISVHNEPPALWQSIHAPKPIKFKPSIGDWVWAYEGDAIFFARGIVPDKVTGQVRGSVLFDGLICHTACIPVQKEVPFTFNVVKEGGASVHFEKDAKLREAFVAAVNTFPIMPLQSSMDNQSLASIDLSGLSVKLPDENSLMKWNYTPLEKKVDFNLTLAILFGFLSGIIMNIMPCVLPVLGIKIISFSETRASSRKHAILKSLVFSSGMLSVFMVLASLASFANFSWGEQFQNPRVLVGIIAVIVIFALGMFDMFMILVPGSISSINNKKRTGFGGDFLNGMFATILATPCSGPLLGATLAWTLTQQPLVIFTIFTSIGVGMAFPYVLFSASSTLSKLIPKPGMWMNDFKHLMGFVLLGFAVYLMIGLPQDMVVSTVGLCLVLVFAIALYTHFAPFGSKISRKLMTAAIALVIALSGVYVNFGVLYRNSTTDTTISSAISADDVKWKEFSVELLKEAHKKGQNVMIDFTANWCVNCQFNKVTVLNTSKIDKLIKQKNIVAIKADLTRPNPQIESLLNHLGSRSVPFLAIFPGENPSQPVIMRDILNKKSLISVLENLQ